AARPLRRGERRRPWARAPDLRIVHIVVKSRSTRAEPQPKGGESQLGRHHDIVVIGGSAGSLEVLRGPLGQLPADLPAAVFAVLHVPPGSMNMLSTVLDSAGPLHAETAIDREPIRQGRVYSAPADRHLLIDGNVVRAIPGPY